MAEGDLTEYAESQYGICHPSSIPFGFYLTILQHVDAIHGHAARTQKCTSCRPVPVISHPPATDITVFGSKDRGLGGQAQWSWPPRPRCLNLDITRTHLGDLKTHIGDRFRPSWGNRRHIEIF